MLYLVSVKGEINCLEDQEIQVGSKKQKQDSVGNGPRKNRDAEKEKKDIWDKEQDSD